MFISVLNTNAGIRLNFGPDRYSLVGLQIVYDPITLDGYVDGKTLRCTTANPISPASFITLFNNIKKLDFIIWYKPHLNSTLVKGFLLHVLLLKLFLKVH
jgi:hypothetical protein